LIILDIMLPKKDWLQVCTELRSSGLDTPIIMLTARDSIEDKVKWLESWADDYVVKPFALKEILARINALIRRTQYNNTDIQEIAVDDLVINLQTKKVSRKGKSIKLTKKQFQILEYLVRNEDKVVSKQEMIENIRWINEDRRSDVIRSHMQMLREKIDYPFKKKLIKTVRWMWFILTKNKIDDEQ
jgi:DNA-binding response OmpR family regulator